ncbi:MAG: hypothetical protein KBF92_03705 [Bacteroidia bacterium]|nr:hypothetical protein [Bacteroidota bacterium]MBP9790200.1 hypothetical protein [Bacteroidia bacterium]MBP9922906.1 hypothetical protein [Bacteroidia bacterium]
MAGFNRVYFIACILLLLPLLYINVKPYQDWGDDYAQYILQARNIVEQRPQIDNGLVFDKVDGDFALHAYPAGFPLLISPVYYFFKLSVKPYLILISVLMISLGVLMFNYFKKYYSPLISLTIVIFILYNHYLLLLKDSILTDIPFVFFLFLLIQIAERKNRSILFYVVCGLLASWLTSIRFVGIASLAALTADILLHGTDVERTFSFNFFERKRIKSAAILILSAVLFFFLFNTLFFHVEMKYFLGFYSNSFDKESAGLFVNAKYYYDVLGTAFFFPGSWNTMPSWWVFLALAGWVVNLRKKAGFTEWFFLFYLLMILLFNRSTGGFRFIFPVFPLLIKYTFDILLLLTGSYKRIYSEALILFVICITMTGYILPFKRTLENQNDIPDGPYKTTSIEMLNVVRDKIPESEVVGFIKAIALSLYTDHRATYLMTGQSPEQVEAMFLRLHVNYLIGSKIKSYDTDIFDPRLDAYLSSYRNYYSVFWENEEFIILKRLEDI